MATYRLRSRLRSNRPKGETIVSKYTNRSITEGKKKSERRSVDQLTVLPLLFSYADWDLRAFVRSDSCFIW